MRRAARAGAKPAMLQDPTAALERPFQAFLYFGAAVRCGGLIAGPGASVAAFLQMPFQRAFPTPHPCQRPFRRAHL